MPQFVFAANLFFGAKTNEVRVGEQFEVKIFINTPEESVNAFEGKITFPSDLIKVKEIRDGNSIVNFWIDKPKAQNGAITFSGITPGGFQGNNGLLFSAVFETKSEGIARFEMNDAKVLRNDGIGSPAALTIAPLEMTISSEVPAVSPAVTIVKDTESPESFVPEISRDESIANGEWFVVFATQDKASGIDHYEVKESRQVILSLFRKWVTVASPYVLQDQELRSYVFVKAVDYAGNERIAKINPRNPLGWYENYENWLIIILGLVIAYAIKKFLWRRYLKK
ncbi:MAG: cohesin domain-containing protein [Candidatus Sungiibacteriota bacterium]